MKKKALVKVVSNANIQDEDLIEVISPGIFEDIEGGYRTIYEETEISGMDGTLTTIYMYENKVVLERVGSTSTKMVFALDEPAVALYNTPYGMLELTISTEKLDVDIDENGGKIYIEYDMAVAGQEPLRTKLNLSIEAK
ncbi:DUF1934 domain-containing protein [Clostridium sp. HCP1S3_B4]|uniref:DUF1934 domain-containing protein n=1 Tax=unclassified Clostridium TaxID=2614128 RepID=UPI003F8956D9|nr:DUF1934 domain-containing protein [Clostridiales bacterium]